MLADTLAGGVTVNDTLWHFAHKHLPFGHGFRVVPGDEHTQAAQMTLALGVTAYPDAETAMAPMA